MAKRTSAREGDNKSVSAGLLMYRRSAGELQFFLAHPGGPFWARRDAGAWTIPKGLVEEEEDLLAAARREFEEETGIVPEGPFHPLGSIRQKAGKLVHAWAFAGDADPAKVRSNFIPLRSGAGWRQFPEIDRCGWFTAEEARERLNPAQVELVERLLTALRGEA
jgi:predicted NUDIX family NTP pyrophosphohydrolase